MINECRTTWKTNLRCEAEPIVTKEALMNKHL